MPEVYRGRKSRGRKSGRKSPRKYSKGRKSGRKSPRHSRGRNRFRGVTYRSNDSKPDEDVFDNLPDLSEVTYAYPALTDFEEAAKEETGEMIDLMIQKSEELEDAINKKAKWTPKEDAIIEELVKQAKVKGGTVRWKIIQKQIPNRTTDAARHRYERLQVMKARMSAQASSSDKPAPQ